MKRFRSIRTFYDAVNYYVENSFAAYPELKLPYQAFEMFGQMPAWPYPASRKGELLKIINILFTSRFVIPMLIIGKAFNYSKPFLIKQTGGIYGRRL